MLFTSHQVLYLFNISYINLTFTLRFHDRYSFIENELDLPLLDRVEFDFRNRICLRRVARRSRLYGAIGEVIDPDLLHPAGQW